LKPSQCTLTDSKDKISNCYWQNYYLTKGYVLAYGERSVMKWMKIKKDQKVVWNEKRLAYMLGDTEVILCKENGIDFCHMHGGCNTEKEITYK
jgi:hypothetical protein